MSVEDMNFAFGKIMEKAESKIQKEESDYIKDGLLYCGKCHTPKQTKVTIFGVDKYPMCLCKCGAEKLKKEQRAEREEKFQERVEANRLYCFGGKTNLCKWTFDNVEQTEAVKYAQNYINHPNEFFKSGQGLLFFGKTGTGKTIAMLCIANELLNAGYVVKFTDFAEISNMLFNAKNKQDVIDDLALCDALIIDDFAIERTSDYMQEIIFSVVNARSNTEKPLFVTTNLSREELNDCKNIQEHRIKERIFKLCVPREIVDTNFRRKEFVDNYNDLAKLLEEDTPVTPKYSDYTASEGFDKALERSYDEDFKTK